MHALQIRRLRLHRLPQFLGAIRHIAVAASGDHQQHIARAAQILYAHLAHTAQDTVHRISLHLPRQRLRHTLGIAGLRCK